MWSRSIEREEEMEGGWIFFVLFWKLGRGCQGCIEFEMLVYINIKRKQSGVYLKVKTSQNILFPILLMSINMHLPVNLSDISTWSEWNYNLTFSLPISLVLLYHLSQQYFFHSWTSVSILMSITSAEAVKLWLLS
jgi:hypothetical protein